MDIYISRSRGIKWNSSLETKRQRTRHKLTTCTSPFSRVMNKETLPYWLNQPASPLIQLPFFQLKHTPTLLHHETQTYLRTYQPRPCYTNSNAISREAKIVSNVRATKSKLFPHPFPRITIKYNIFEKRNRTLFLPIFSSLSPL